MQKYFTTKFWDYAGERALKTVIQTLVAGGLIGPPVFGMDWVAVASLAAGTALLSLATSVLVFKGDGTDDPNQFDGNM